MRQAWAIPTGREKADALSSSLAQEMADARFISLLECHEFEALVLVDPPRIRHPLRCPERTKCRRCVKECAAFATAEDINLGQHVHPKIPDRARVQGTTRTVAGPSGGDIGFATLSGCSAPFRENCLPDFGN